MSDIITLTGIVATTPRHLVTSSQVPITSFRLASGQRRFDRAKNAWVDATTNWYTVSTFRQLAFNVAASVHKGEHVIVTGRLRIRDWDNQERNGTSVDVEADSVGHDLMWCTATAVRNVPRSSQQQSQQQSEPPESEQQEPGVMQVPPERDESTELAEVPAPV
ncbi:MAG TPA: single-stranded DNA-binding protein [Glaciibacter sp.]|nr:single-stranded DNA-binding protein [Glaciibacter sp.]